MESETYCFSLLPNLLRFGKKQVYQLEKLNRISDGGSGDSSSAEGKYWTRPMVAADGTVDHVVVTHVELHVQYVVGITGA